MSYKNLLGWASAQCVNRFHAYYYPTINVTADAEALSLMRDERTVVYVVNHVSLLDWPFVSRVLSQFQLSSPRVILGENMEIPFIKQICRYYPTLFLKRTIKNDPEYAASLLRHVKSSLRSGESFLFSPEGARTRTGHLCPGKSGMISILLDAAQQVRDERTLSFVPIFMAYDNLWDLESYSRIFMPSTFETAYNAKRKLFETAIEHLDCLLNSKRNLGHAHMRLCKPITVPLPSFYLAHGKHHHRHRELKTLARSVCDDIMLSLDQHRLVTSSSLLALFVLLESDKSKISGPLPLSWIARDFRNVEAAIYEHAKECGMIICMKRDQSVIKQFQASAKSLGLLMPDGKSLRPILQRDRQVLNWHVNACFGSYQRALMALRSGGVRSENLSLQKGARGKSVLVS